MKKKITFIIILLFILSSKLFSQSNWYLQNTISGSELRSVFFANQSTGWIAGFGSTIIRTTNGGINWTFHNQGSGQGLVTIFFIDSQTGWIGGGHQNLSAYITKTTNCGQSWTQVYSANNGMVYKLFFVNSSTGWGAMDNGQILNTTNGGLNWSVRNSGVNKNLTNCTFVNTQTGWISGDYGTILKTTNGGNNWVQQNSGTTENLEGNYFLTANYGFIVGNNGVILKTTNSGVNWVTKTSGSIYWLNSVCFTNNNTGWVVGGAYSGSVSQILRTCNAGENWSIINVPSNSWLADVEFVNLNTGWAVGSNGVILKTTNGGAYIPQPPVLITPPDNSIITSLTPALVWNISQCAASYKVQISASAAFNNITDSASVAINQYLVPAGKLSNNVKYYWRVRAVNSSGIGAWSSAWNFTPRPIGIEPISTEVPESYSLDQNYPNPFNPSTKIRFSIPAIISPLEEGKGGDFVNLTIYNLLGKEIVVLVNEQLSPGTYEAEWDASDYPSGMYFYKLTTNDFSDVKKMVLVK